MTNTSRILERIKEAEKRSGDQGWMETISYLYHNETPNNFKILSNIYLNSKTPETGYRKIRRAIAKPSNIEQLEKVRKLEKNINHGLPVFGYRAKKLLF